MNTRRKFSSEQKAQIVLSIIRNEVTAVEMGKKHQIAPNLIYKWRDEFLAKVATVFDKNKNDYAKDKKMKQYEHVIAKLTTQNDFLDKVLAATE